MQLRRPPRRWAVRGVLAALLVVLVLYAGVATATHEPTQLGPGTISQPATGQTVISVQGFHHQGKASANKPARLAAAGPNGSVQWVHNGKTQTSWFYDVDPLPDGTLLVTSTVPGDTVVYEYDPETGERLWTQRFDAKDTHDVDLINGDQLLVGNLRNYNESAERNDDRVFVYDLSRDEVVWQWHLRTYFDRSQGSGYTGDWSHLNDVDKIGDGRYLLSPRNMDQVLVVNRSTGRVTTSLGEDQNYSILNAQHNPDFFLDAAGRPTILVADSGNDRVVEYTRVDGEWERTWTVTGFHWPRDADRLPNGNTLVTDTLNHRVVEITPTGKVVWEVYAPWAPYDSERVAHGPGSNATGPAMIDRPAGGTYEVHGGDDSGIESRVTVADFIVRVTKGTPLAGPGKALGNQWAHIVPFIRPFWMPSWAFGALVLALFVGTGWGVTELVYQRRRVRRWLGRVRVRVADRLPTATAEDETPTDEE
ncbi:MAG: aryl-sulfate sulfotransferase [Haloarculaceae archaeon]